MAIDSENKRRSCISHKLPMLGIRPRPDGAISQPDRRHSALYYAGIDAQYIPTTFWVPSHDTTTTTWGTQSQASSQWKQSSTVTNSWSNQVEIGDE